MLFFQNAIQGVPYDDSGTDPLFVSGKPLEWVSKKPLEWVSMEIITRELFTTDVRKPKFNYSGEDEIKLEGQTITSATATCTPTDLTTGSPAIDSTGSIVRIPVSGAQATPGVTYTLTCVANLSGGGSLTWKGYLYCPA